MGVKQFGLGDYEQSTAKKRTRRERFLAEMQGEGIGFRVAMRP